MDAGYASTVSEVLEALDQMDPAPYRWWSQIANREERAFAAEGYIAPITYELPPDATLEEALGRASFWVGRAAYRRYRGASGVAGTHNGSGADHGVHCRI